MKKLIPLFIFSTLLALFFTLQSFKGGYFDVYFENKCSKEIKLKIRADGSSSEGSLNSGAKEKKPVKEGYEIYVDGKLFKKIESSDSGKTIVVCN